MARIVTLFIALFSAAALGAGIPEKLDFHPEVMNEFLQPLVVTYLEEWWRDSLALLKKYPPKDFGRHLLNWGDDQRILNHKTVTVLFVTQEFALKLDKKLGPPANLDMRTFVIQYEKPHFKIMVRVTADEYFDKNGRPKADAYGLFFTSFAREIFGNVQHLLEFDGTAEQYLELRRRRSKKVAREIDIRQGKAAVDILTQILNSKDLQAFNLDSQRVLKAALAIEVDLLKKFKFAENGGSCSF